MKTLVERCARPDVHKDVVVACVRVPGSEGGRQVEQHSFGQPHLSSLALRDWLEAQRVTLVGMEAIGTSNPRLRLASSEGETQIQAGATRGQAGGRQSNQRQEFGRLRR